MGMTILEGSTFCICDEIGDLDGSTSGFFAEDTRFLSRLELRVNGARPLLLSSGKVEYFSAAFYLRNPRRRRARAGLALDRARALRRRGDAGPPRRPERDRGAAPLRARARGRHRLRGHHLGQGARLRARRPAARAAAARRRRPSVDGGGDQLVLEEPARRARRRRSCSRGPGEIDGSRVSFELELGPRERWDLRVDVVASLSGEESLPLAVERRFGEGRAHVQASLDAWHLQVPRLRTLARRPRPLVRAVGRRPRRAADADGRRHRDAPRRRDAVVHDRLRPRHADHVPADDAPRPRARARPRSTRSPRSRPARTIPRSTPSRARSCTSCAAAGRPRPGSAPTTARSTRRRSS